MRKKIRNVSIVLLGSVLTLLAVIGFLSKISAGTLPKAPESYGFAVWKTKSGDVWFKVEGEMQKKDKKGAPIYEGGIVIGGEEQPCKIRLSTGQLYFLESDVDEDKIDYGKLIISGYYGYKPSGYQTKKLMPKKLILDVNRLSKHYSEYQRIEFFRYPYGRDEEEPETDFRDRKIWSSYAAASSQKIEK